MMLWMAWSMKRSPFRTAMMTLTLGFMRNALPQKRQSDLGGGQRALAAIQTEEEPHRAEHGAERAGFGHEAQPRRGGGQRELIPQRHDRHRTEHRPQPAFHQIRPQAHLE